MVAALLLVLFVLADAVAADPRYLPFCSAEAEVELAV